jgi:adenine-specific DNA-methyltransferase
VIKNLSADGGRSDMAENVEASREKVKSLLKELFQFDTQDLDFGIYRIMNFKRKEIERFIDEDLIAAAEAEFKEYAKSGMVDLQKEADRLRAEIVRDFGEGTIDEQGKVLKDKDAPKIREYLDEVSELASTKVTQSQIEDVFNHIYEFFSRYYDKGDFISKRRYGGREKYYIPYNGEEVLLHWANNDQYYVKTGEYFKKYGFMAGRYRVNFALKEADMEQNNIKSGSKYFILPENDFFELNEKKGELTVFFTWRELTNEEKGRYGTRDAQRSIVSDIVDKLLAKIGDRGLGIELRKKADEKRTILEKNLSMYVEKNAADYFIHKNLKSFLEKELDFYLKNEVLDLDEIEKMDEKYIRMNKAKIRAIKVISGRIIDFLSQIEDFQKKLFEKKKLVLRTDYCMTLDMVPEALYEEIGRNVDQVAEWKRLFKLDETTKGQLYSTKGKEKLDPSFLKSSKYLVLDTGFFDQNLKDRLLASFDNLDEKIGGLLVKSENFHALNLLKSKYEGTVKCVYLDPPYNTGKDEFLYKDNFQHSSWLTMMDNRLRLARSLTNEDSVWYVSIDDNEQHHLRSLMNDILGEDRFVSLIAVVNNLKGRNDRQHIATAHEYMLMYAGREFQSYGVPLTERMKERFGESDEQGERFEWRDLRKRGRPDRREDRPNMFFPIFYNPTENAFSLERRKSSDIEIYPKRSDGTDGRWRWGKERVAKNLENLKAYFNAKSKKWEVHHRIYLNIGGKERTSKPKSIWLGGEYSTDVARRILLDLQPDCQLDYPKAVKQLEHVVYHSVDDDDIILDFFAGAGTTAHAVLNVNAADGGDRKYILVEMADYFETVLKPTLEKKMYSKTWKDGLPTSNEGISHAFKYTYLEQYEDTLSNIVFRSLDKTVQETLDGLNDYFLRYMLDYETRGSPTRILIEKFQTPFDYKIKIITKNGEKEQTLDLVETFNYLLGLYVQKLRTLKDGENTYRVVLGKRNNENIIIIWRSTKNIDLQRDKKFIEENVLSGNAPDTIFINGDSYIKNAKAIEPEFKRLMGA